VFALGAELMERRQRRIHRRDFQVLLQPVPAPDPRDRICAWLDEPGGEAPGDPRGQIRTRFADVLGFDHAFGRTFVRQAADEGRVSLLAQDAAALMSVNPGEPTQEGGPYELFVLQAWSNAEGDRRARNALILSLCESALAFLGLRSAHLGLGPKAERLVGVFAQSLTGYIDQHRERLDDDLLTSGWPRRFSEMLLTTTLEVADTRPDLFTSDEHVQTLARAFMGPLRSLNSQARAEGLNVQQRIDAARSALRGPIAINLLETLQRHGASLAGDQFGEDKPLGILTNALLDQVIEASVAGGELASVFSTSFFARAYPSLLTAVAASPEAFVPGRGDRAQAGRDLLQAFARKIASSSALARAEGASPLRTHLFEVALDVARRHGRRYVALQARAGLARWSAQRLTDHEAAFGEAAGDAASPWAVVAVQLVAHVAETMIESFERNGVAPGELAEELDLDLFLDLVRLIVDQAAETPGMILPNGVNDEVKRIAEGVAAFVASEHTALLSRRDWRRVSAEAVRLAMANPQKLFSLSASSPDGHLAVTLTRAVLESAHARLWTQADGPGAQASSLRRAPGRVMFGETLASAVIAVLGAAARNASKLAEPQTQAHLIDGLSRLGALAEDQDALGGRGMTADEWLDLVAWLLAETIAAGQADLSEERLLRVLSGAGAAPPSASAPAPAHTPPSPPQPPRTPPASEQASGGLYFPVSPEGAEG
jgi:hypothetical protein